MDFFLLFNSKYWLIIYLITIKKFSRKLQKKQDIKQQIHNDLYKRKNSSSGKLSSVACLCELFYNYDNYSSLSSNFQSHYISTTRSVKRNECCSLRYFDFGDWNGLVRRPGENLLFIYYLPLLFINRFVL